LFHFGTFIMYNNVNNLKCRNVKFELIKYAYILNITSLNYKLAFAYA